MGTGGEPGSSSFKTTNPVSITWYQGIRECRDVDLELEPGSGRDSIRNASSCSQSWTHRGYLPSESLFAGIDERQWGGGEEGREKKVPNLQRDAIRYHIR